MDSTLNKAHILIVDDQQANIDILNDMLEMTGYTNIKTTTDPRSVVGLFNTFKPDLILLDLMMPHLSGFQVMEQLGPLIPADTYFPILVLTADVNPESKTRALAGGASDFLTKPFDLVEVDLRIKNLLNTKFLHGQLENQNQILEIKVKERTIELENANRELQVLEQAKSDFLSIISHEINTPLNGIIGFIDILKMVLEDPEHLEMLDNLDVSAKRLEHFAKISLLITRLKTNNASIFLENVGLAQLIEKGEYKFKDQLSSSGIELNVEGEIENSIVHGDLYLLEFCVDSLLENALKYSPQNGVVTVNIKTDQAQTNCSFIDQGDGFSSKAMQNLFKLFAPGEQHVDQNEGLGLALVKLIMDAHKGEIKVRNNSGAKGAIVELVFKN